MLYPRPCCIGSNFEQVLQQLLQIAYTQKQKVFDLQRHDLPRSLLQYLRRMHSTARTLLDLASVASCIVQATLSGLCLLDQKCFRFSLDSLPGCCCQSCPLHKDWHGCPLLRDMIAALQCQGLKRSKPSVQKKLHNSYPVGSNCVAKSGDALACGRS